MREKKKNVNNGPFTSLVLKYESPPEFPDLERFGDVGSNCVLILILIVFSTDFFSKIVLHFFE